MRLILMRHAKSSWATGLPDLQRPLNARGERDAPIMGSALRVRGWLPDAVISSDAQRTRDTWRGLESTLRSGLAPRWSHRLYGGSLGELQMEVAGLDSQLGCLLLIGHNPGWSDAASWLSGGSLNLTTANAVLLRRDDLAWSSALHQRWELVAHLRPKDL